MNNFDMNNFLFKISFYIVGLIAVLAFLGSYADGNTDDNYMHFAVEKPQNIILGDSRGAQAMVPHALEKKLSRRFDNFSLNIVQSPYGPVYLKALKKKLDPNTKNGIFILTVNPWNLALNTNVKKSEDYPEEHSPLNNMFFYDLIPNYEYLLKNYSRSWFKIYMEREEKVGRSNTFLHKDGWMEVNVDMNKDSIVVRTAEKTRDYILYAKEHNLSKERVQSFKEIIEYLSGRGTVYLVRIPTSESIAHIESKKFPEFTKILQDISLKYQVSYFDFSDKYSDYIYTDGNHMYKESGKILSSQVADSILLSKKEIK